MCLFFGAFALPILWGARHVDMLASRTHAQKSKTHPTHERISLVSLTPFFTIDQSHLPRVLELFVFKQAQLPEQLFVRVRHACRLALELVRHFLLKPAAFLAPQGTRVRKEARFRATHTRTNKGP